MEERCEWCESNQIQLEHDVVYWELPDGTKAIEIENTPSIKCSACQMKYQKESIIKEIEDQLFLIDTKQLGKKVDFEELMKIPRLLKRNYFDFSK
ncbi:YokU family protein [Neobacillus sp. D3-1R]|uniref:YokU family protein n=1 Tax=Neobacillus sp. D3-1R TaxID=3445778 RepID=UPI003F9F7496